MRVVALLAQLVTSFGMPSSSLSEPALRVIYKDQSIRYEALIDSGADLCIFGTSIAEALGIDVETRLGGTLQ